MIRKVSGKRLTQFLPKSGLLNLCNSQRWFWFLPQQKKRSCHGSSRIIREQSPRKNTPGRKLMYVDFMWWTKRLSEISLPLYRKYLFWAFTSFTGAMWNAHFIYDILMACSALENITSKTSATAGTMDIITTENRTFEEMYKFNGICRKA